MAQNSGGPGGMSFVNYADYMTITNAQILSGTGVLTVTNLAGLATRQLADACRVQLASRAANGSTTISFDINSPGFPNELGTALAGLRNVGLFGVFGIVPVQAQIGGTVYPQTLLNGMTVTLKAYGAAAVTGSTIFNTPAIPVGEMSQQSQNLQTTMPNTVFSQTPAGVIALLDAPSSEFYGQGWGGPTSGNKPNSFRVEIFVPASTSAGQCVFDIGRLWIGNAFRPVCGVSNIGRSVVDTSQLQLSRDNQAYAQYFNRMKQLQFSFAAMTEMEAFGIGLSPRGQAGASDGDTNNDFYRADNYEQMMYALGTSKECVAWLQDYRANNNALDTLMLMKNAVYGHVTSWQNLGWPVARRATPLTNVKDSSFQRRMWTGGCVVQEER